MKKRLILPALLAVSALGGCESSETATKIAKLQEQIGRVAQQLSDTKKQVDGLQEANQRSVQALENLEAAVERLNAAGETPPMRSAKSGVAGAGAKPFGEQDLSPTAKSQGKSLEALAVGVAQGHSQATGEIGSPPFPTARDSQDAEALSPVKKEAGTTAAVSCSQVWKQLGQGRSPEAAARALGVQVAVIHACEQKIGRGAAGR